MKIRTIALWGAAAFAAAIVVPFASVDRSHAATALTSGKENTSILVQNVGASQADFIAEFFKPDGTEIPGATQTFSNVPAGGTRNFEQASNGGLPLGYRGLAVISSDQKINTLIERDILDTGSRKSYSITSAYSTGGHKLAVPLALNELLTADWNSRISVVNTGSTIACIRATYLVIGGMGGAAQTNQTVNAQGPGGSGCSAPTYPLASGAQITFGRAGTGVTQFPGGTYNNQMAVLYEVVNPGDNKITASVDVYRSDGNRYFASYSAFIVDDAAPTTDDIGSEIVAPLAIRSASGYYTEVGIQVIDDVTTDITINYVGVDTDSGNTPVNYSVTLQDVTDVASRSIYQESLANIPVGFSGYARVSASGGARLAVVQLLGKQTTHGSGVNESTATGVNGVPTDRAATEWSLPEIFRRFGGVLWNSYIQVQVADGSTATVTLEFVGDPNQGCPVGPYTSTQTVTGAKTFHQNSDDPTDHAMTNAPPNCFFGGATVTANKPIIVIATVTNTSNVYPNSDNDGTYNGFPAE